MARAKVSQAPVEVLFGSVGSVEVSQVAVEVLVAMPTPSDLMTFPAIGTYGDECNTVTIDAAWTLRNISSVTGTGSAYPILFDAQGDAFTRAFTDPAADFEIAAHLSGTGYGGMIGLCALNASGTGIAFSPYNDGSSYIWNVTTYAYASTGGTIAGTPAVADFWIELRRVGTAWSGRYRTAGGNWSNWSVTTTNATTMTQIGIIRAYTGGTNQTVSLERFLYGQPIMTNAIVSQHVVEVLVSTVPKARVSQAVVEVLISDTDPTSVAGGEHSYTYVK